MGRCILLLRIFISCAVHRFLQRVARKPRTNITHAPAIVKAVLCCCKTALNTCVLHCWHSSLLLVSWMLQG